VSSAPKEYEKYTWNGEVKHRSGPSASGWKRWHCRCPGCWVFGQEINRRNRAREQAKRDGLVKMDFKHGLEGYRTHKCRCDVCSVAGKRFNDENRAAGRTRGKYRKSRSKNAGPDDIVEVTEPEVDWSTVEHLRPGHGVRRRKAA
jgi:hypothetical protein